ncbi:hypothetical protein DY000_02049884 [Brassica cretica]|uniref:Aspartic peptidase DDI1-type domain-containing protein n=1 Tax=Brassica cretica TaxID=69181 RepID=A0ABQ7EZG3_BRACR|nr:hypothetical protein DY000_02049884 [Brassica cretica]
MTSRHTRRKAQGELVTFSNQELARLERTNRQQPRQTDTTMGDHANQDDLAAAMQLIQQQMQHYDTQKIDELTAKVVQLLKNNQGHVFNIEQATAGQIQNQNQRQPQRNRQAVLATGNSQPDELKVLGMMMQQLLQGTQIQGKALNQVSTDINTRMENMLTELNTKYDTVSNHIKRIDVQLAQTDESVKRQQGMLPGKSAMNPRVEHCNETELRCEKAEGREPEQLCAETALGAEERTEQPASSEVTAPDEPIEIPPVRVYVPKVPYPIPFRHLMDPISAEQLAGFRKMVRRLPQNISFEHAWEIRPLHMFFKNCREFQEEIKVLYTEALTPSLKELPKVDDPGKFVFPFSIAGVKFKEALCDSGSSVNLVSKAIVDELGIVDVEPYQVKLTFANSSMAVPYGTILNLPVQVGDCVFHTEFQVVVMRKDHEMPLIFGMSFMATVGEIVDMPNKRVSFSNINKKVFYKAVATRSPIRYASCLSVVNGEQPKIIPKEFGDKSEIKEVLDGDPHTDTKKLSRNARLKEKVQKKRVKGDPTMTLIPRLCDEKSIEYECYIDISFDCGSVHIRCMTSRHTRRNARGELVTFTNQELARLERTNRQQPKTDTTTGDQANQDDLIAAMALMQKQKQVQQLQQTIQAQEQAAQQQQEQTKIDELTAKVDQLLKNNQGHVFSMKQATAGQIHNQNQRQPQSNRQAVPATGNNQPDEMKGLGAD